MGEFAIPSFGGGAKAVNGYFTLPTATGETYINLGGTPKMIMFSPTKILTYSQNSGSTLEVVAIAPAIGDKISIYFKSVNSYDYATTHAYITQDGVKLVSENMQSQTGKDCYYFAIV